MISNGPGDKRATNYKKNKSSVEYRPWLSWHHQEAYQKHLVRDPSRGHSWLPMAFSGEAPQNQHPPLSPGAAWPWPNQAHQTAACWECEGSPGQVEQAESTHVQVHPLGITNSISHKLSLVDNGNAIRKEDIPNLLMFKLISIILHRY